MAKPIRALELHYLMIQFPIIIIIIIIITIIITIIYIYQNFFISYSYIILYCLFSSGSSRPLDKGGGSPKKFFSAHWVSVWSKNKGGPSPGSTTGLDDSYAIQHTISKLI